MQMPQDIGQYCNSYSILLLLEERNFMPLYKISYSGAWNMNLQKLG